MKKTERFLLTIMNNDEWVQWRYGETTAHECKGCVYKTGETASLGCDLPPSKPLCVVRRNGYSLLYIYEEVDDGQKQTDDNESG